MTSEHPPPAFAFLAPVWLEEVDSTNDCLKERAKTGRAVSGAVVAARRQTRGRGRMDAVWESSMKGDLTFSFFWSGKSDPVRLGSLAMACALGVRDFLAAKGIASQCKWPNDVLVDDAKICGILAEGGGGDGFRSLVVGIGVNLRRLPGREERLGRRIAALEDFVDPVPGPEALLPEALAHIERRIRSWESGGFAALRDDLTACLWGVGRPVSARTASGRIDGVMSGLGEHGELRLRLPDGGETSVASVSALEGWSEA